MNEHDWVPPSIPEIYKHYCKRNNLKPELSSPAELFPNNCYAVACVLKELLPKGARAVYGGWLGVDVRKEVQRPFCRHGWVEYAGHIIDPTRFQFEGREPYMFIAYTAGEPHEEYDEGMSSIRKALRRPPPKREEAYGLTNKELAFSWLDSDKDFLTLLFGDARDWSILTTTEVFWLANLSPDDLKPIISRLYTQVAKHDLISFIPVDFRSKYNFWVQEGQIMGNGI